MSSHKPKIISIEKAEGIAGVEDLLGQIETKGPCDVMLPKRLPSREFGGVCSVIQFLVTWSKRCPAARLLTYVGEAENPLRQLRNLLDQDHGLAGVLVAADTNTRTGSKSIRTAAFQIARERVEKMRTGVDGASRGTKVFLLCADHTTKAYLPLLYHQTSSTEKAVKGVRDFRHLAKELLGRTAYAGSSIPFTEGIEDNIGRILYELFGNTDKWAKKEYDGQPVRRSIRGIRFETLRRQEKGSFREASRFAGSG